MNNENRERKISHCNEPPLFFLIYMNQHPTLQPYHTTPPYLLNLASTTTLPTFLLSFYFLFIFFFFRSWEFANNLYEFFKLKCIPFFFSYFMIKGKSCFQFQHLSNFHQLLCSELFYLILFYVQLVNPFIFLFLFLV